MLDLVLAGHQTRAIAEALFITVKTVEFHRGRIHQKLGVAVDGRVVPVVLCTGAVEGELIAAREGKSRVTTSSRSERALATIPRPR